MISSLTLEYEFDEDGDYFGRLNAQVKTTDFCGKNHTWVQWTDLLDWAAELATFPIAADQPIQFDCRLGSHAITTIIIGPRGATGGLIADVRLAEEYQPEHHCRTSFETDYPSLIDFKNQLERMIGERRGMAVLQGM